MGIYSTKCFQKLFSYPTLVFLLPKVCIGAKVSFLQEEPGGQCALIFDQGNRISQVRMYYYC